MLGLPSFASPIAFWKDLVLGLAQILLGYYINSQELASISLPGLTML